MKTVLTFLSLSLVVLAPGIASAHCDTMDGPVVKTAQRALETGKVEPVLAWIQPGDEAEVRAAFAKTLSVRKLGPEAKDLADRYFFETLVRVHRAGEGEPYTGIKPSGTDPGAGVHEADLALEKGDVDELAKALAAAVSDGVKSRFARALEARKRADKSVDAGREYVAAYVEYLHYVERLHEDAAGPAHHHGESDEGR